MSDPEAQEPEATQFERDQAVAEVLGEQEVANKKASSALRTIANSFDRISDKIRLLQETHPSLAESLIRARDDVVEANR